MVDHVAAVMGCPVTLCRPVDVDVQCFISQLVDGSFCGRPALKSAFPPLPIMPLHKIDELWPLLFAVLSFRATRVCLVTGFTWFLLFITLKHFLWRDPHSGFFQDATVYELGYSALRRDEARAYIAIHDQGDQNAALLSGHDPTICAAMVTYKRPQRQYLNESIGSLLVGLTTEERQALNIRLLFSHSDPWRHPDWNRTWLQVVDSWSGYELSASKLSEVRDIEAEENFYAKGVM